MNIGVIAPLVIFLSSDFRNRINFIKKNGIRQRLSQNYFLGGRELGGFVLAMTMVATYGSASSFLGGPGTAYTVGFGWVLLAMTQVVTGYFVLLILRKEIRHFST